MRVARFRDSGRRQRFCHDVFALEFRPAHVSPLNPKGLTVPAHLGRLRHPPGHRSSSASRKFLKIQAWAFIVPEERPCLHFLELEAARFSLQSLCRESSVIETVILS